MSGATTVTKGGQTKTVPYGDGQAAQPASPSGRRGAGTPPAQQTAPRRTEARNGRYDQQDLTAASRAHHANWEQLNRSFAEPSAPIPRGSMGGQRG